MNSLTFNALLLSPEFPEMIAQKLGTRYEIQKFRSCPRFSSFMNRILLPLKGEPGSGNSSRNPPKGAIDDEAEILIMEDASRKSMRL
jgi:hypothetical protein